jgi:hypothetical protein
MNAVVHARYLADGRLAGAAPASMEPWLFPNMLVVDAGWVSQYPPGHLLVVAGFVLVGLRWAVGPVLFALMVGLSAASFERLLPPQRAVSARAAAILLSLSPFGLLIAGGALSHLTAGAAGAAALYFGLRATDERRSWAFAAGAAVGLMVLARPWTGLLLGPTLTLGVWLARGGPTLLYRLAGPWILGGIPAAALLLEWNTLLFGGPLTLGYEALYGPAHGLGLHVDPWSFPYGLREAVGYSASDVLAFGAGLLETPVSVTAVGGAFLAWAVRLSPPTRVLAAWALLPVFGNALYWFHQPRMLFEAAPAWILLAVLAIATLYERSGPVLRSATAWAVATTLLIGAGAFAPARFRGSAWSAETLARITIPADSARGALVFVHAPWTERVAALLQASGMRNDSIQPILRRNDACRLHEYAVARISARSGPADLPPIDHEQTHRPPAGLTAVRAPGGAILVREDGATWSRECLRELAADRFGALALAPLLWQGDLPGLEQGRPLFARDYGPERNEAVRALFATRPAFVLGYASEGEGAGPRLIPYDDAMRLLWEAPAPER